MIEKIQIENFQKHKNIEIKLDPGVNVIVGSSDTGKSSIVRALKWLFQNRPQGDGFRTHGIKPKDETRVCAVFEDGQTLSRDRSNKVNQYTLNADTKLKALRSDVPQDVKDIAKMKSFNLQSQHPEDQYFLLTDSPGNVAKKFNKVTNLEVMDRALSNIKSKVTAATQKDKFYDEEIKNKKEELKELKWVPEAKREALQIKELKDTIEDTQEDLSALYRLLESITGIEDKLKSYKNVTFALEALKQLKIDEKVLEDKKKHLNTLKNTCKVIYKGQTDLLTYKGIPKAIKALNRLKKQDKLISDKNTERIKLIQKTEQYIDLKSKTKKHISELNKMEKEFGDYLKDKGCPLCGRKM